MHACTIECVFVDRGEVKASMHIHSGLLEGHVVEKVSGTIYDAVKLCVLEANRLTDEVRAAGGRRIQV